MGEWKGREQRGQRQQWVVKKLRAESFGKQRFLRQFIVDENLKAIYCFVPKVACTGWKTWFREQQGQANVSDVFLTHDKARSGLRILAYHFPEHGVTGLMMLLTPRPSNPNPLLLWPVPVSSSFISPQRISKQSIASCLKSPAWGGKRGFESNKDRATCQTYFSPTTRRARASASSHTTSDLP
ncbi:unnamed protein product [Closterium sp. NIES-54]